MAAAPALIPASSSRRDISVVLPRSIGRCLLVHRLRLRAPSRPGLPCPPELPIAGCRHARERRRVLAQHPQPVAPRALRKINAAEEEPHDKQRHLPHERLVVLEHPVLSAAEFFWSV